MTEDRNDPLDRLLRQASRQSRAAGATPSCLDAETMAAWMEGGLSGAELAAAEAHASSCARCQAMLAAMARIEPEGERADVSSLAPESTSGRNWWPWVVPFAAAAVIALAVWTPWRTQQPRQESTVALAPAVEVAPQVVPLTPSAPTLPEASRASDRSAAVSSARPQAAPVVAPETTAPKEEPARADRPEFRREVAAASPPPPPAAAPAAPPPPPPPAPPPAATTADALRSAAPPANPSIGTTQGLGFVEPVRVIAEFRSPDPLAANSQVQPQSPPPATTTGTGAGAAGGTAAGAGAAAGGGRAAGGRGGAGGGGGGGRGGAARGAATPAPAAPPLATLRWRVLGSGTVERSTTGTSWEPVVLEQGVQIINGAAPSPLVCWLVGRGGVVLLTIDGARFTRLVIPETADLAAVRATDARSATVTTADGRTLSTSDGGQTWIRN